MKWLFLFIFFWPSLAWARVPSPSEVVQATLAHAQMDLDLDRWSSRSRLAGLAPQVSVSGGYRRVLNVDDRFKEQLGRVDDAFEFKSAQTDTLDGTDTQWSVSIDLRFDFERVVFNRDEFAADEAKRRNFQLREQLSDTVLNLYYEWLSHSRLSLSAPREIRIEHIDSRDHAAARLNALTGGWFQRTLDEVAP